MLIKHELKKLFKLPVIPLLIIFFIALNILIVLSHQYIKNDLAILTDLIDTHGYEINEEMMKEFGEDYQEKQEWMQQIAPNTDETYEHPSDLLADETNRSLGNTNYQRLLTYNMVENYYRTAQNIDDVYENIHLDKNAEELIQLYGFTDNAAATIRSSYQKLDHRLEELVANGEHKNLFFMGKIYEMHSFLFKNIGLVLIFELMILVVLITAAIANYEFEHRTAFITYTTKRGRRLVLDKLFTAMITNLCVMVGLIGSTLGVYFLNYDYSGLWHVPISSYFNAEMPTPYISWWNLSFIEYLGLFIVFIMVSQLLFMAISYVLSIFLKNTYLVFFSFIILLGLGILIPSMAPMSSNWIFWLNYNPFALILNPHEWLMGNGPFTIHPYYEVITISGWLILLGTASIFSIRSFYRQPLQ